MRKKSQNPPADADQALEQPIRRSSTGKRVVVIILSLLLLLFLIGYALVSYTFSLINHPDDSPEAGKDMDQLMSEDLAEESSSPYETVDPDDVIHNEPDEDVIYGESEEVINILLIGQDRREGEGRCRSDAMILCSFDTKNNTLTMASFLRDLYVKIPGYKDNRLNYAYPVGGMELLDQTMLENFSIHIDANIEVDFSGFTEIIDILGGVDIELTEEEVEYLNKNNKTHYTVGVNHMDGEQALAYSRLRYIGTDFGRTDRQRNVLTALMEKFGDIDLNTAYELMTKVLPLVTTDIESSEMMGYITKLLPVIQAGNLESFHVPADDAFTYATIRHMSVVLPNWTKVNEQLKAYLAP